MDALGGRPPSRMRALSLWPKTKNLKHTKTAIDALGRRPPSQTRSLALCTQTKNNKQRNKLIPLRHSVDGRRRAFARFHFGKKKNPRTPERVTTYMET